MATPQIIAPGRSGWNLVVAILAFLLAVATALHGTVSLSEGPPAPRGDRVAASLPASPAPPEFTRSARAPVLTDAPARAAAVVLTSQPEVRPRTGAGATFGVGAGDPVAQPLSPTRFYATSRMEVRSGAPADGQPAREAHVTATPELGPGDRVVATVSFYYCSPGSKGPAGDGGAWCGVMRDGNVVYPGAAACDYAYLGQQFRIEGDPTGRVYTCNDTGSAVHGLHRDIWFHSSDDGWRWQRDVGKRAVIEVLP